jgi:hypothetical protein
MTDKTQQCVQARSTAGLVDTVRADDRVVAPTVAVLPSRRSPGASAGHERPTDRDGSSREPRPSLPVVALRPIFLLVEEYRVQCQLGVEPHRLAAVLSATLRFARHGLAQVEQSCRLDAALAAGNEHCLRDLDLLLCSLLDGDSPPPKERLHAMDDLIVQLVLTDARCRADVTGS